MYFDINIFLVALLLGVNNWVDYDPHINHTKWGNNRVKGNKYC
jgi:hypothetical protein